MSQGTYIVIKPVTSQSLFEDSRVTFTPGVVLFLSQDFAVWSKDKKKYFGRLEEDHVKECLRKLTL